MARDLDEMEDDNPIEEDFENNTDECPICGESKHQEQSHCSEECRLLDLQIEETKEDE